jgi:hypothetical protein
LPRLLLPRDIPVEFERFLRTKILRLNRSVIHLVPGSFGQAGFWLIDMAKKLSWL